MLELEVSDDIIKTLDTYKTDGWQIVGLENNIKDGLDLNKTANETAVNSQSTSEVVTSQSEKTDTQENNG